MSEDKDIPKITISPETDKNKGTGVSPRSPTVKTVRMEPEQIEKITSTESLSTKYLVLEKIGDGGMGVVYLGQDKRLNRYVAIKRLNKDSLNRPSLRQRFFQEAKAIAALQHSHIVHVYSLGEDQDGPYIVMEYISGPAEFSPNKTPPTPFALDDRVHKEGPLNTNTALDLMIKLCRAVVYAHSAGIIHRDLKPSNILLDENLEPKIVDYGLARVMSKDNDFHKLTVPGEKMLSLGYGAPEQEKDASKTDERADVYGLGALLYFSLTGQNPRYFRPDDMPESIRMPIVRALEPDRNKRWPSVKEFLDSLLLIKAPSSIELPTVKRTWRCKWCDTVNPVAGQYCGKCGWDGGEECLECGAEMRVGIPFCGHCGADTRDYEMANRLYGSIRKHWEKKDFQYVIEKSGSVSGFTPGGPNGRKMVDDTYRMQKKSDSALKRRDKLIQTIPLAVSSREYERAKSLINEYNSLSADNAFTDELARLPELTIQRDLEMARTAIDRRDWIKAARSCNSILKNIDPRNMEAKQLQNTIKYHRLRNKIRNMAFVGVMLFFFYVFSAAPVFLAMGKPEKGLYYSFYKLAGLMHEFTILEAPLKAYSSLWGAQTAFIDPISKPDNLPIKHPVANKVNELTPMRAEYQKQIKNLKLDYTKKKNAWPTEYIDKLGELQRNMQRAGDYEGWESVQMEIERFEAEITIREYNFVEGPVSLNSLQSTFFNNLEGYEKDLRARTVSATGRYLQNLKNLRTRYTKEGKMEKASSINDEIERIETGETDKPPVTSGATALPTQP